MNRPGRHEDWFADADITRAQIFVPAIMGAGILISVITLMRDALRAKTWRGRARRVALEGHATAHHVLTGEPAVLALTAGVRPRVSYLLSAVSCLAIAAYVGIGATANYLRPGGYVADIVWLWAVSLVVTAALGGVGMACAVAFVRWPRLARWQLPLLAHSPLGQRPPQSGTERGMSVLLLGWAAAASGTAAAIFTFVVAHAPHRVAGVDTWAARTVGAWRFVDVLGPFDPLGPMPVYLMAVVVIGLAAVRCPAVTVTYAIAAAFGLLLDFGLQVIIPRDGPQVGAVASFPSGHDLHAMLLIGFVPLALLSLTRRKGVAWSASAVFLVVAVAARASTLHGGLHWWSDTMAGALWGGALALTRWWVLAHRRWHRHCVDCPLAAHGRTEHGAFRIRPRAERVIRLTSRIWVPVAVAGFGVLAVVVGLPANPDGDVLGAQVDGPAQLALLGLVTAGWLVALRWEASGAVLLALAGTTLGALAALAYHPVVSLGVAAVFLAPAVGFWLVWQHRRAVRAVAVLAVVTTSLLSVTWFGASTVYDRYYGPTHPSSTQQVMPVDRVVWSWAGGVTAHGATVVAELVDGARRARLRVTPVSSGAVGTASVVSVGADHVVRLSVDGLHPGTDYRYRIEVDGELDNARGFGVLGTAPAVAGSLTVAFGACARTGSNGAVYDAIRALRPDLYVATGDLHYGNPSRDDVELFANLYRQTLTAPAQAALYRAVPIAYVWDDHDYGPNDAGATAPTRAAYDRYVPHHTLAAGQGGAIHQAFTMGRVRFVLTDTRSERTATSMLGDRQRAWLAQELVAASRRHALVVWVDPDPWIAPAKPGADDWGGYAEERRELADVLATADVRNLVMVAGDAHMVAIDDGTNTGYGTEGGSGFPLLHAAALDRPGNVKGGPYSEGAFPGGGQFGTVSITDSGGSSVEVALTGYDWHGRVLTSYRFTLTDTGTWMRR